MRTIVVYKDETDYARTVTDYMRDFKRQTGHDLESLNPDEADGAAFCRTYDIVEYPSIVALSDDGSLLNLWRGLPLPTISELSYYV